MSYYSILSTLKTKYTPKLICYKNLFSTTLTFGKVEVSQTVDAMNRRK